MVYGARVKIVSIRIRLIKPLKLAYSMLYHSLSLSAHFILSFLFLPLPSVHHHYHHRQPAFSTENRKYIGIEELSDTQVKHILLRTSCILSKLPTIFFVVLATRLLCCGGGAVIIFTA